ncbi:hypothetical protein KCX74_01390, partial [Virgibacillus salarius]
PAGLARAENPLCNVFFFAKLVEAVPAESEVISRSIANIHLTFKITTWLNAVIALILYFLNL